MPNRASELDWDEPRAPSHGLTRAAIVRAAIEMADTEGLDAVSIRRVAAKIRARPMSLYTHIASKDDLLDLMIDAVVEGVLAPEPFPDDWREALRAIARQSYAVFVAHPWLPDAIGRGSRVGPNVMRHAEQSAAAVAGLGLNPEEAWTVLGVVDDYTFGHALRVLTRDAHRGMPDIDATTFPQLAALARDGGPPEPEESFEVGLEVVLDGIEQRFA